MKRILLSEIKKFQKTVWDNYRKQGRVFPWRKTHDPYRIYISEIMLQQTQTDRVVPKYNSFIKRFPNFKALSEASFRDVFSVWQGLGYNRRARFLLQSAKVVMEKYDGKLPKNILDLQKLPGIGKYTAGAIAAFAHNEPAVFVETNIRSVFIHYFFPRSRSVSDEKIIPLIEKTLDTNNPREWYWALMDYGSFLKKHHLNPSQRSKSYAKQSPFHSSNRRIRGLILKIITEREKATAVEIAKVSEVDIQKIESNLIQLQKEKMIVKKGNKYSLV